MSSLTPKQVPYPVGTDAAASLDTIIEELAEWVDANPGIAALSTAGRNALVSSGKWVGRVIYNTTTSELEKFNGTSWVPLTAATVSTRLTAVESAAASAGSAASSAQVTANKAARGYMGITSNWDVATSGTTKLYVGTMPITVEAGRYYKVTLLLDRGWYSSSNGDNYTVGIEVDGVDKGSVPINTSNSGGSNLYLPPGSLTNVVSGLAAGSRSFRAYAVRNSGVGTLQFRGALLVEDIGG